MPTNLTGLLIFVVLIAPGFVYVIVTERGPFARTTHSVLRETASIILVSLLCNGVALGLYVMFAVMPRSRLASPETLIADSAARWTNHRVSVLVTAVCLLLVACLTALLLAALVNNSSGYTWIKEHRATSLILPAKGARTESAWWGVLRRENPDLYRRVTCYLLDGTRVRGWLHNFNPGAAETEDRELTLAAPLRLTAGGGTHRHIKTGFITVSARQIQFLHVNYYSSPDESTAPPEQRRANDGSSG